MHYKRTSFKVSCEFKTKYNKSLKTLKENNKYTLIDIIIYNLN